ncbi:MAG: acyl-CoA synthetase [Pseudomonadales bacterium]
MSHPSQCQPSRPKAAAKTNSVGMHPGVHSQIRPDAIAFCTSDGQSKTTYRTLDQESNQTAHFLRSEGLKPRDGIAILLDNDLRFLTIAWAAQRSGLYYTPISTLFKAAEVCYILENSGAKVLFTKQTILDKQSLDLPEHLKIIVLDQGRFPNWQQVIAEHPPTECQDACEGAEMIYSSGTTGQPKGVRFDLALSPVGTVAPLIEKRIQLHCIDPTTRYLSTAPLYHSAPLRYNLMVSRLGGTAVIMPKFDALNALELIQEHRITHSQWVPTMFNRLLALPEHIKDQFDLSSLRYAIHAAAPCPVNIKKAMIDWWGEILYEYYSGTESNGSTAITSAEWLEHPGSVGKAFHGELHILDDDYRPLAPGSVGGVYFAKGTPFAYFKDPEKTAAAQSPQGYTTLGDMGYLDEDGYLYLKDRRSFMIISGGVNIYPQEIEDLLVTHEAVIDAAVFGIPDAEFGESVKAVVELHANYPEHLRPNIGEALMAYCRENLSHVKCPRSIDVSERLPRHPTGKLYKGQLRAPYWADHDSMII